MMYHARLSRRTIVMLLGLVGLAPRMSTFPAHEDVHRRRQQKDSPWSPADGLRLAGPVQGLGRIDPALSRDLTSNFVLRQVFRGLVRLDENLDPVPDLAEAIELDEDGITYRITLHPEARFHDGSPVTGDDVAASLSRALYPATADDDADQLPGMTYLQDIVGAREVLNGTSDRLSGITVVDDRALVITLSQPSATFTMKLASVPASIVSASQLQSDPEWWASPHGSGPYTVAAWDDTSALELRAFESYPGGQPVVEEVTVLLGPGASQPPNLYQAGEIDLVTNVPSSLGPLLADLATGVPGIVEQHPLYALSFIALGNRNPPLDDMHVRRALAMAFPAERVASATLDGEVEPAHGLIPPGMLGADWLEPGLPYDVEAARAELAQSRYGTADSVPPIAIYATDIGVVETFRDAIAENLGLTIDAMSVPWSDFLDGLSAQDYDAYSLYWGADYPDPEALLWMLFGSDSPDNYTAYTNPEFDELLAAAREESTLEARIARYRDAQRILLDDAAVIPLFVDVGYSIRREGMAGLTLTPMGVLGLEGIHGDDDRA